MTNEQSPNRQITKPLRKRRARKAKDKQQATLVISENESGNIDIDLQFKNGVSIDKLPENLVERMVFRLMETANSIHIGGAARSAMRRQTVDASDCEDIVSLLRQLDWLRSERLKATERLRRILVRNNVIVNRANPFTSEVFDDVWDAMVQSSLTTNKPATEVRDGSY
jgi:hypothetical protein